MIIKSSKCSSERFVREMMTAYNTSEKIKPMRRGQSMKKRLYFAVRATAMSLLQGAQ